MEYNISAVVPARDQTANQSAQILITDQSQQRLALQRRGKLRIYRSKLAICRTYQMIKNLDAPGLAAIGARFCESKSFFEAPYRVLHCDA